MEDPVENIGAKLVRQAASKTNDLAGDGTTTSVVLAQGLINEGVKVIGGMVDIFTKVKLKSLNLDKLIKLLFIRWWQQVLTRFRLQEVLKKPLEPWSKSLKRCQKR